MATHKLMHGDLQIFKRTGRRHWQCAASIGGRQYRFSTKEESLSLAKEIAKDWYLEKIGKSRAALSVCVGDHPRVSHPNRHRMERQLSTICKSWFDKNHKS